MKLKPKSGLNFGNNHTMKPYFHGKLGRSKMSKFKEITVIKEFVNDGIPYGVYSVIFNDNQEIFIRNNDSLGVVSFFYDRTSDKCVSIVRNDVKEEFFDMLSNR